MTSLLRNSAVWVLLSATVLFWMSVAVIGTPATRNAIDFGILVVSITLTLRLLPAALAGFIRGGSQDNWRFLMGNVLFWAGITAQRSWALAVRWYDQPQWMVDSPWNGFFAAWIFGAGVLCISASAPALPKVSQHRIYYICVGILIGALGVLMAQRMMTGAWP